jgi:hypothetical protein
MTFRKRKFLSSHELLIVLTTTWGSYHSTVGTCPLALGHLNISYINHILVFSGNLCETPPSLREACPLCYKYLISHSTEALNAASLPAFSAGLFCTRGRGGKNVRVTKQRLHNSKNTHQVTANSKSVGSSGRVRAAVPRCKVRKFLIGQVRK